MGSCATALVAHTSQTWLGGIIFYFLNHHFSPRTHQNTARLSPQQPQEASAHSSWRREPAGDEAVTCDSSEPDPALLLHLGSYLKKKKKKEGPDLGRSSRHLPTILSLLVLVLVSLVSAFLAPELSFDIWFWHLLFGNLPDAPFWLLRL